MISLSLCGGEIGTFRQGPKEIRTSWRKKLCRVLDAKRACPVGATPGLFPAWNRALSKQICHLATPAPPQTALRPTGINPKQEEVTENIGKIW